MLQALNDSGWQTFTDFNSIAAILAKLKRQFLFQNSFRTFHHISGSGSFVNHKLEWDVFLACKML